jgi:threonyl-tRNA synthetase
MDRDHGWIHTLLEEAENERMHLLTFLKLRRPGLIFRLTVVLTQVKQGCTRNEYCGISADTESLLTWQGLVMNLFFISYLVHPPLCHR